jgi:hypothetical protein
MSQSLWKKQQRIEWSTKFTTQTQEEPKLPVREATEKGEDGTTLEEPDQLKQIKIAITFEE